MCYKKWGEIIIWLKTHILKWRSIWDISRSTIVIPLILYLSLVRILYRIAPGSLIVDKVIHNSSIIILAGISLLITHILTNIFCPEIIKRYATWEEYNIGLCSTLVGIDFVEKIRKAGIIIGINLPTLYSDNYVETIIGGLNKKYFSKNYFDEIKGWPDLSEHGDPKDLMRIIWKSENISTVGIRLVVSFFLFTGLLLLLYGLATDIYQILITIFLK